MNTAVPPGRGGPAGTFAAAPVASQPAPRTGFTTAGLPPAQQFDAWRHQAVPFLDITPPAAGAAAGFEAGATTLRFGPFLMYASRLPAHGHARSAARIRRDSLDHWIIAMCRRGTHRQRSGETMIECRPGVPYVLSMARAFEAQRSGGEIDWVTLHVARDSVPELEATLASSLHAPLDGAAGVLLAGFMAGLRDGVDSVQAADLPHLATAAQALLHGALHPAGAGGALQLEQLQLARLRRIIRDNLGAATLTPRRLAALAGMSRSQLYRLFEPMGGVAHFIKRERLRRARRLLSDPSERRDIATLAEEAGFFDPSSFSRAFRREFGCTPREARAAELAGGAPAAAAPARGTVLALLRDL
ncbi:helix-turn-helix domain-containing protein [Roseomonas sp. CECT 9278]|uniref:helix-turn-helix domain-containing protein n=1 Tax=Roseomonas sp. CECT 9278 TaxID=2845823 RepID=UPI001E5822D8|nr:helix-turn-helix domain-containing protein [Roseomonas sp. CECT 9278]CAH0184384.1 hypothetical protein ROS9278_01524 [Roseomonas sp. CECT 9278]